MIDGGFYEEGESAAKVIMKLGYPDKVSAIAFDDHSYRILEKWMVGKAEYFLEWDFEFNRYDKCKRLIYDNDI